MTVGDGGATGMLCGSGVFCSGAGFTPSLPEGLASVSPLPVSPLSIFESFGGAG